MAIESTNHAPEYPVAKDTTQNDIAGSHLLASAYGEQSFAPPSERRESSSENGIQVASALSAGIWTGLQRDAQRDGGTMTDASPEQPEVILAGLTGKLYVGKLRDAANDAVNRTDLGNVVPRNARNYAGEKVPPSNQCASTLSDLLINAGLITSRDYQIRVTDMVGLLNGKVADPKYSQANLTRVIFEMVQLVSSPAWVIAEMEATTSLLSKGMETKFPLFIITAAEWFVRT